MATIIFVGYVLYLYTPHLLFKFRAAAEYDLWAKKDVPQVEEFFAAGLPSFFLNAFTLFEFNAYNLIRFRSLRLFGLDRAVLSRCIAKDPDVSAFVSRGSWIPVVCYYLLLAINSWWLGANYGETLNRVAAAGGTAQYLAGVTSPWLRYLRRARLILFRWWKTFYWHYENPFYPHVLRESWVFVHTEHGIFHGRLFNLVPSRDGGLEGLIIVDVSRYDRDTREEELKVGRNPISGLSGPLFIKWSEVLDINFPPTQKILTTKRAAYDGKLAEYATAAKKAQADAGTLPTV